MTDETTPEEATDETVVLGQALQRLRKRAGMNQAEAGEKFGVTQQTWQRFESGQRASIFRLGVLRKLTASVDATPEDLNIEAARIVGQAPRMPAALSVREEGAMFATPLSSRVRMVEGALAYDLARPDAALDLSWLFGDDVGALRVADDHLKGLLRPGQVVVYDRARFPAAGELAVIETMTGETYLYKYLRRTEGLIQCGQTEPEATVDFPSAAIRGVYAIRMAGDG